MSGCLPDIFYNNDNELPPVSKETFIELATMSNCNVLMLTHDGFYRQKEGLAMGSPPAPNLREINEFPFTSPD